MTPKQPAASTKPQASAKPKASKGKWQNSVLGWKNSAALRFFLFLFLFVFLYFSLSGSLLTETYDIEVNTVSPTTILAKERIENVEATERAREEAAAQVETVYTTVNFPYTRLIESIYNKLEQINSDTQFTLETKAEIYRNFFPDELSWHAEQVLKQVEESGNASLYAEVEEQLESQRYRIPEEVYFKFPTLTLEDIEEMEPVTKSIVSRLVSEPVINAAPVRDRVAEMVNSSELTKTKTRELVQEIARFVIMPNRFVDEEARLQAVEEAKAGVQPVYIEPNEPIVREGQMITPEIYRILEEQGLLKAKANYGPQIGLIILVLLFLLVLYWFMRQSDGAIKQNNAQLIMFVLIFTLNVLFMHIVKLGQTEQFEMIGFLAPVSMGTMLVAILIDTRLAFMSSILYSVIASVLFKSPLDTSLFDFRYGLVSAVVCFVSIFSINKASQRSTILRSGLMVSLFAGLSVTAIILLMDDVEMKQALLSLAFAVASGLITAVLVIGLLPFFEVTFGILSPLKLVELTNPNHPLLRKLLTETPGTYHHSIMVGNLAEAAAEAIGANGLLCRVGSYYHDVGKTRRPSYFIENQMNIENPHNFIEPALSKSIIVAHAKDGAEMLREHKMPKQLCDIAEQHHGTTLLKYFYHKALKQAEEEGTGEEIREDDYRYPGPKAQTKEAAIVGIADSVEAAVRSLRNPTIEQIGSIVDKIIKERLEDNQFNECDLTLKELDTIGRALKESLLGIFHSRIEYPDLPKKENDSKAG